MLKIKDLSFSYGNETVFDNVTFQANNNEITIIKGESGSGKTTLLDILSLKYGIFFKLYLNDKELINKDKKSYINNLCYISSQPQFCHNLTLQDQWNILSDMYGKYSQLDKIIKTMGLDEKRHLYPSQLSGGEQLRAAFISLFIIQPKIILLDEPTASLDDEYKEKYIELLKVIKENSYVVVSSHDPHLFKAGDKIYEIKKNKLYLEKQSSKEISNHTSLDLIRLNKNKWFLDFFRMKKHHLFKEIITCLFVSLSIALCAFSINIDNGFLSVFEENLQELNDNKILVYKSLDLRYPKYDFDITGSTYFPISTIEQESIKSIKHIVKMNPKVILSTYIDEFSVKETLPSFSIMKDNQKIFDYQDTITQLQQLYNYNYFTLFVEGVEDFQVKEYSINTFDYQENGIYINKALLNKCELNADNLKEASVKVTLGIPTYDVSGVCSKAILSNEGDLVTEDNDFVPANLIHCEPKEIVFPINGIIDTGYDSDLLVSPEYALYMSNDTLFSIANSSKKDKGYTVYQKDTDEGTIEVPTQKEADYTYIYTPWQPNAYHVEVDSVVNLKNVVNELENRGYSIDWKYNEYQNYGDSIRTTKNMLMIISGAFAGFIIIVLGALHFIKGKEEQEMNSWLNHIGYHQSKDILKIKFQKYLLNTMIMIIGSYLILWIINFISIYIYYTPYVVNVKSWLVIIGIAIISQIGIPMIWEGIYHVKN